MPSRRLDLAALILAALAAGIATSATTTVAAEDFPSHPVHLVVGFAAGSSADIVARLLAQSLAQRLGQPFVVENRPGASTNIATETVVGAPPDGYTLLVVVPPNAINATLDDRLSFNFSRDIVPVAGIARNPFVMEVNPSVPAKTVAAFIAYAKANPGKVTMASGGNGSGAHMTGELFNMMAGVTLLHVPYHGDGPALVDLIGGQVQVMFGTITSSIAQIRAGQLRALAVTTRTRSDALPDVPTLAETVPGYEAIGFVGIGAPKATPAAIVDKLNKATNAALVDPAITARLADLGLAALGGSPANFATLIAAETEKWAKVIKFANIKTE